MGKTRNLADLTDRIVVDSSGHVGIGTNSPSSLLDVDKSQDAETNIEITNTNAGSSAQVRTKYTTNGGLFTVGKVSDAHTFSGAAYLWNVDNTNMLFATADAERMRIDSSGNVSINSTSPDLVGNTTTLTIGNSNGGGDGMLSLQSGWGNTTYGRMFASSGQFKIGNPQSNNLIFYTSNLDRLKIDSNGRVTTPYQPGFYARRSIAGDGRATGAQEWTVSGSGSYNTGNHFDASNGRFTAPVDGKYIFAAAPGYKQSGISFNFYYDINGTHMAEPVRFIGSLDSHSLASGTIIVNLSAGDYVQVYMGSTHHVNTTYNYFSGYLVG